MRPRRAILVLGALCLSGCVTSGGAGKDAARDAWGDCIARAVDRLDDGRTDPVSIAAGVSPRCAGEYARLSEIMVRENFTERGQAYMRSTMRDEEIKLIASAVLTRRAARRDSSRG